MVLFDNLHYILPHNLCYFKRLAYKSFGIKMIKSKRGMEGIGIVVSILAVLVVFLVLFPFVNNINTKSKEKSDIETCRLSVLAREKTKFAGKTSVNLDCPRRQIIFYNNKVEINGKKDASYNFKNLDDKTVNEVLAKELRLCWYKLGEGKVNGFDAPLFIPNSPKKLSCLICSEIKFDDSLSKNIFYGLEEYLKNTKTQGTTYWDYIIKPQKVVKFRFNVVGKGFSGYIQDSTTSKIDINNFEAGKDYIIYYSVYQTDQVDQWINSLPISNQDFNDDYYIGVDTPDNVIENCGIINN